MEHWLNRRAWWLVNHWLLVVYFLAGLYVALPLLAPLFMHYGYIVPAQIIYRAYRITCHQLPERSHFIFGYQVAICQRDNAIWVAFFLGGLLYGLRRHTLKILPPHWWILALIPIGLDGGTQLVGPLYEVLPNAGLTGFALLVWLVLTAVMWFRGVRQWQYYLFVFCFPLGMAYVHLTGPRLSNWQLRTVTGAILGLANAWFLFPVLEESFLEIQLHLRQKQMPVLPGETGTLSGKL
jgi:uncharacterized membrane protein